MRYVTNVECTDPEKPNTHTASCILNAHTLYTSSQYVIRMQTHSECDALVIRQPKHAPTKVRTIDVNKWCVWACLRPSNETSPDSVRVLEAFYSVAFRFGVHFASRFCVLRCASTTSRIWIRMKTTPHVVRLWFRGRCCAKTHAHIDCAHSLFVLLFFRSMNNKSIIHIYDISMCAQADCREHTTMHIVRHLHRWRAP